MATYRENLITARDEIAERLAEITAQPQPDYSIDGQSVSWSSYLQMLMGQLETLNKAIQQASAPFWSISRGKT